MHTTLIEINLKLSEIVRRLDDLTMSINWHKRQPTLAEIAKAEGVSVATISRRKFKAKEQARNWAPRPNRRKRTNG